MSRGSAYRMIRSAGKRSGVRNAHPHRFRHTFAVEFLRNGGNAFTLKDLLGHTKLDQVLIYVQLAEQDIDSAGKHSPADSWRL